jgi:hypothetical protein
LVDLLYLSTKERVKRKQKAVVKGCIVRVPAAEGMIRGTKYDKLDIA